MKCIFLIKCDNFFPLFKRLPIAQLLTWLLYFYVYYNYLWDIICNRIIYFLWQPEHHRSHFITQPFFHWHGNVHSCHRWKRPLLSSNLRQLLLSLSLSPNPSHTVPLTTPAFPHLHTSNTFLGHSKRNYQLLCWQHSHSCRIYLWSSGPLLSTILPAYIEVSNVKHCFRDKLFFHDT